MVKFAKVLLRLGPLTDLKECSYIFTPDYAEVMDDFDEVKDLEILFDNIFNYKPQIKKVVKKTNSKTGWAGPSDPERETS